MIFENLYEWKLISLEITLLKLFPQMRPIKNGNMVPLFHPWKRHVNHRGPWTTVKIHPVPCSCICPRNLQQDPLNGPEKTWVSNISIATYWTGFPLGFGPIQFVAGFLGIPVPSSPSPSWVEQAATSESRSELEGAGVAARSAEGKNYIKPKWWWKRIIQSHKNRIRKNVRNHHARQTTSCKLV